MYIVRKKDESLADEIQYKEIIVTYNGSPFVMRRIDENNTNYSIKDQVDLYEEWSSHNEYYSNILYYDDNVYTIDKKNEDKYELIPTDYSYVDCVLSEKKYAEQATEVEPEIKIAESFEETIVTYKDNTFLLRRIDTTDSSVNEQIDEYKENSKNNNYYALYYDDNNVYSIKEIGEGKYELKLTNYSYVDGLLSENNEGEK